MPTYGGFWIRVLAYIIDMMILQFAWSFVALFMIGTIAGIGSTNEALIGGGILMVYGLMLVVYWLYFALMESSKYQATIGKQALKLIVTDEHGERISFGRATGRYFAKFISSILLIGFFLVGWTEKKQGLHDMIANTLVYKADSPNLARNSARVFE